ncbi:MAG: ABC transporter permease subunit [Enhydrobacter sp.]|nr:MAG: ABC transporter permease subunit [Enhydrobacter sp.]
MPQDAASAAKGGGASALVGRRDKATKRSVILADKAADWIITVGGLGVILAVFGIMVFLLEVVVPLFTGGSVVETVAARAAEKPGDVVMDRMDEYRTLSVALTTAGDPAAFHVPTGKAIEAPSMDFGGKRATAFARTIATGDIAFGFADGTVRFGKIGFDVKVLPARDVPPNATLLGGKDRTDGRHVFSELPGNQARSISVSASIADPQEVAPGAAIVAVDYRVGGTVERPTRAFVTVDEKGVARLSFAETKVNLLTRKETTNIVTSTLPALPEGTSVAAVLMTEKADQVYIAERSGRVHRYDTRNMNQPRLAETVNLLPQGVKLTAFSFLIGEQSLVVGASDGSVDIYFRLQRTGTQSTDGYTLVRAHRLEKQGAGIVAMDVSKRSKMFVTADSRGEVWVRHSTTEQTLLKLRPPADFGAADYKAVAFAPRDDAVLAIADGGRYVEWNVSIPHPETTLSSIFGKVWYEGYQGPEYTWQSSSGTDSFEPKFSLVPLIFGTLKSTFYALLMAVPIALAAAIFTSEFLHPTVRSVVKPAMEMMASLPSVVLGFIAALIVAPIVETQIASVLLAFVFVPLSLIAAAYLWQFMPQTQAIRLSGVPRFALMFVALAFGIWLAGVLGGPLESLMFAGDFKAWVNRDQGSPVPFLTVILLPIAFVAVSRGLRRFGPGPRIDELLRRAGRTRSAAIDGGRWLAVILAALLLAYVVSTLLSGVGYDPRGGMIDTYVQRNTLVVGFAMGFAVIPIIYTIAEDALNSVPEHLRGASLACGATQWQTATKVILPTAASGVFAAVMIGMGRAVGETMIVVMAAGNTPILDMNIFNGLRALSANIAVELPEAVRNDSLYRMLFLAALTLFAITFVVNTVAEVIRQRFRRRAVSL